MSWIPLRGGQVAMSAKGGTLALRVKNTDRLRNFFPQDKLRITPLGDQYIAQIPYVEDSLQLLRNAGYRTEGIEPIRHKYKHPPIEGKYAPMAHQLSTAAFLVDNPRAFCTSDMRTGKTASVILATDYLQTNNKVTSVLILTLVSTMAGVWRKEIKGMLPDRKVSIVYGTPKQRVAAIKTPADYYIVNYDGLKIKEVIKELKGLVHSGVIDCVVVDECTKYSESRSDKWNVADELINGTSWTYYPVPEGAPKGTKPKRRRAENNRAVRYCWGLTGTPGNPDQIYGQVKLVNPKNMTMSFTRWKESVMFKVPNTFKWIPLHDHKETIFKVMQPCIRFKKSDVMDLPPVLHGARDCELSKEQATLYKQLRKEMYAMANAGESVTAPTKSALASKLLQVACGSVRGDKGIINLDMTPRLDELEEIIKESTQKVVVFAAFTAVLSRLETELTARGYAVGRVDGTVTGKTRDKVFHDFLYEANPKILLAHPTTTAFGVELASADTMVFFGPPMSGEFTYQQAAERLSSLKQKADSVSLIHLAATNEERVAFESIKKGVSINEAINDMFLFVKNEQ